MTALLAITLCAVALVLILRAIPHDGPSSTGRPSITFEDGQTAEIQGDVPLSVQHKLAEIARMFKTSGTLTLIGPGQVDFSDQVSQSDRQRFMNALATTWAVPRPST